MKKSLIALAAFAATSAFAQSSVTLYGIVEATTDIGYNRTQDASATTSNFNSAGVLVAPATTVNTSSSIRNNFRVQDGSDQGTGSSRVGFRGTEDLGGGLKANFLLEMGLRIDDGCTTLSAAGGPACDNGGNSANSGGSTFGRNAWGGLSGGFGEVRVGRQVLGSFAVQGNSGSSGSSNGLYDASTATMLPMGGIRFSNAIRYMSPDFGGFKGSLMLAAPETGGNTASTGLTTNTTSRRTGVDLALEYANGPAYVGFGYNKNDGGNVTSIATPVVGGASVANVLPRTTTGYTIGGAYDLGVVKPFINYTRQTGNASGSTTAPATFATATNNTNSNARALSIGLRAPVGAFTVIAGLGRVNTDTNGIIVNTTGLGASTTQSTTQAERRDAFQLGAQYALSKRTLVEANYGYSKLRLNGNTAVRNGNYNAAGEVVAGTGTATRSFNSNDRISSLNVGLKHSF